MVDTTAFVLARGVASPPQAPPAAVDGRRRRRRRRRRRTEAGRSRREEGDRRTAVGRETPGRGRRRGAGGPGPTKARSALLFIGGGPRKTPQPVGGRNIDPRHPRRTIDAGAGPRLPPARDEEALSDGRGCCVVSRPRGRSRAAAGGVPHRGRRRPLPTCTRRDGHRSVCPMACVAARGEGGRGRSRASSCVMCWSFCGCVHEPRAEHGRDECGC